MSKKTLLQIIMHHCQNPLYFTFSVVCSTALKQGFTHYAVQVYVKLSLCIIVLN
jgi:hypothetical protein